MKRFAEKRKMGTFTFMFICLKHGVIDLWTRQYGFYEKKNLKLRGELFQPLQGFSLAVLLIQEFNVIECVQVFGLIAVI